jgi:hypothetical protein
MSTLTTIKHRSLVASGILCALYWTIVVALFSAAEIHAWQLDVMKLCGIASLLSFLLSCACMAVERVRTCCM